MQPSEPTAEPPTDCVGALPESAEALPGRSDPPSDQDPVEAELVLEELLVSEVSIDGMCGVY